MYSHSRFAGLTMALVGSMILGSGVSSAMDEADSRWLHAYVLTHTGDELGERQLWPLALANYSAALQQFESLAKEYPDFQPRLVNYRRENLKLVIAEAQESMNAGDHDLAMLYEEVIETSRLGAKSRCHLDFGAAYRYLMRAQWQLNDILRRNSDLMAGGLEEQKAYIDELAETSRKDLLNEPEGSLKVHSIEMDFAEHVSEGRGELPAMGNAELDDSEMSSGLFPSGLVAQVRNEWYF